MIANPGQEIQLIAYLEAATDMPDIVVYHNPDSMGLPASDVDEPDIFTNKRVSHAAVGNRIWLLTGEGRPRRFFLRGVFTISGIGAGDERGFRTRIRGAHARFFSPMIDLTNEEWFSDFKRSQGNFASGSQAIGDERVVRGLEAAVASELTRARP